MNRIIGSALAIAVAIGVPLASAGAQDTIKIGDLSSYKSQPAFLEPYRRGWTMALEEVNAKGGALGKKIEFITRDDNGNPGDAVRVAEELVTREGVVMLAGTFLSHIGLAVTDFAGQKKVLFLATEPLTDKITWTNGNRYTFRLRASTSMQVSMLVEEAAKLKKKRWAITYPNFEFGQVATEVFKTMMKAKQPDIEFVTEQSTPLGRIDAGAVAQALDDAKPDAIFSSQFGTDLAKFAREGNSRGTFKNRTVVGLLTGEPEYLDPLKEDTPEDWIVTGYPWEKVDTPAHKAFVAAYQKRWNDYPRLGSIVGYLTVYTIAEALKKAGSTDTEKMIAAFRGLKLDGPLGPFEFRKQDQQSTLGAFVGKTTYKDGKSSMKDFKWVDGAAVMPPDDVVAKLRPAAANQ